ncbi:ERF family protein [Lactobacillus helveticus]|uniref:Essential recombination function protein n=1 Tax=Lactobacillus helveticus CIRM-BIA 951 TaxID=1226334 RepID=U6F6E5_LACHE|nr:ERF family protein [Lactobacillus helveticus]MDY0990925.1 ERF family protein [Lactobacillus helveticus]MDY1001576.1 ERF family protein [Lactobacillus helveticus]MEB2873446.1 ERF family protein [Lactobacillus helveticus]CDI58574.1 Essential recombination function protein [Lactobacillus helveticus CIRM-BIA 951]
MTEAKKEKEKKVKVPILTQIQNELKAPKNQWNDFGHYKYRNAEDIESALKPLLAKYGAQLTFDEEYREVGGRIYAVEIATYKDSEQEVTVKGWAREAEHKKGMDESQISGSTSSYAIKYALGKLFLIDDTKDADSQKPETAQKSKKKPTKSELITVAKERRAQYGGGKELVTDIVGLEMDGDMQARIFLNSWCAKNPKNQALYTFIKKNNLATHGMKVGA